MILAKRPRSDAHRPADPTTSPSQRSACFNLPVILLQFRRSSTQYSTRPHRTLTLRRRNYVHHRSLAWSPSFRRETRPSHYRNDPVKYDLVRCYPSTSIQDTKSKRRLEKGVARTQTPTNKNYALELLTFETIVGVSSPGVQWTGLALGEPPS